MAQDEDARGTRQRRERAEHPRMCSHLGVAQFILAVEVGRRGIDDDEINATEPLRLGGYPCSHCFNAEGAGDERNLGLAVVMQILVTDNSHAEIVGILAGEIDNSSLFCRMPAKGGLGMAAADEPRNQQGERGLAMAGLRCQRVNKATLQDAIEQIIRRNKSLKKISYGYDQVCRRI